MKLLVSCLTIIGIFSSVAPFSCKQPCCDISNDLKAQHDIRIIINETLKDVVDTWNSKYSAQVTETANLKKMVEELTKKLGSLREIQTTVKSCPSGWVMYGSSCYKFIWSPLKNWRDAKAYCSKLRSNLVEIENSSENKFLRQSLTRFSSKGNVDSIQFWIGNSDLNNEGVWTWATTGSRCRFTDWESNEPNGGRNENCGTMFAKLHYHWNDSECQMKHHFICEKHI